MHKNIFRQSVFRKKEIVPFSTQGQTSLKIRGNLIKLAKTYFPCCKIQVVFKSDKRLGSFFSYKDMIPINVRSLLIYKFTCSSCNSAYVSKTKRHFMVRMFEHLGISIKEDNHQNLPSFSICETESPSGI